MSNNEIGTLENPHARSSMSCRIKLEGLEQLVMTLKSNEKIKITSIGYSFDNCGDDFKPSDLKLENISYRAYLKSKKLSLRTRHLWSSWTEEMSEIIPNIPDHFHDKARKFFKDEIEKQLVNLQKVNPNQIQLVKDKKDDQINWNWDKTDND